MTAPNIVNIQTLTGTTTASSLTTTTATTLVSNNTGSNTVVKLNTVIASNSSLTSPCTFSLYYNTGSAGSGTSYALATNLSVPATASLIALDKSTIIYLQENTSLVVQAGTASVLNVVVSYEIIS
jgi:hypothetical protein